jgi:alpha-glucosidase (family GH31 glycosyl hydrolase)
VENLFKKYHNSIVGNPVLVPQWAFGWHQSRWGVRNTSMLYDNIEKYAKYDLPLDTQWSDIDYMHDYQDF